jgi:low temperature requirement protein LtrA
VVALAVRLAHVDVAGNAPATGDEVVSGQPPHGDPAPAADVGDEGRGAGEHPAGVRVVPLARRLAGEARELDADRGRVAAAGVPGDVGLADALDDAVRVDAVVRRHAGHAALEPARADLGRIGPLRDLHRVHHNDVGGAAGHSRVVRARDERVRHAVILREGVDGCEDPGVETIPRTRRLTTVRREEERVTPLELFFDLVFVLALTQCTALMAATPTWEGLVRGLLVLAVLWWSWGGYAWLTSVVDPEEGAVRIAMFVAMAAFLVAALSVPNAFGDDALMFACAYGIVRVAHIWLFTIASRDEPELRRSVTGLAASTAIGVGLLLVASLADGWVQGGIWALALTLDVGGPYLFRSAGWQLIPAHFAERHGLILIIALGESIVAIGVGSNAVVDAGVVVSATLGMAIAAALWWLYFDVIVWLAERRLLAATPGREQNELARDAYSLIHFPMVAGIVLLALGLKKTLEHVEDPLETVPAAALVGGVAVYLLAHVAFRWRLVHSLSRQRLVAAAASLALFPAAVELPAPVTLALVVALLCLLIAYEVVRFADTRERVRHELAVSHEAE